MIGQIVHDYALGKNGIVIGGAWTEDREPSAFRKTKDLDWEWLVLYEDGEFMGADTNDLKEIE